MNDEASVEALAAGWRRNHQITVDLLAAISDDGLAAVPLRSRGRSVARQLLHVAEVRKGWVHYHSTGERPRRGSPAEKREPGRDELVALLVESGELVAEHLALALRGKAKVRYFGGDAVRWLLYLVAHESHHRGQIALALKQAGMRLPEKVAVQGLWGRWIFGKEP